MDERGWEGVLLSDWGPVTTFVPQVFWSPSELPLSQAPGVQEGSKGHWAGSLHKVLLRSRSNNQRDAGILFKSEHSCVWTVWHERELWASHSLSTSRVQVYQVNNFVSGAQLTGRNRVTLRFLVHLACLAHLMQLSPSLAASKQSLGSQFLWPTYCRRWDLPKAPAVLLKFNLAWIL